ncbi:MAG: uroporphyrinogen-III C-methyltransferase [Azoarcus sp. PHD]|nr:MAG: uroporphyrinogen-III C-methyltransferase [Azoarcus sp. PHD]
MTQSTLLRPASSSLIHLNRGSAGSFASPAAPRQPGHAGTATGSVALVGAGPGDPELLTMKAARRIAEADVIVYDQLVGEGILDLARPDARRIYAGKKAGRHALPQDEINLLLVELALQGLRVVRLKGGDPFIFGRGGEEMQALIASGIACEVVPGVTAAAGMAASTGIPLTHRDHAQTVVFATGHLKEGSVDLDWDALARPHQTIVIYMGLGALDIICRELVAHGLWRTTPAAVVHAATTPQQRIVTSTLMSLPFEVRAAKLQTPSLIIVGTVVELHPLLTQAAEQTAALAL